MPLRQPFDDFSQAAVRVCEAATAQAQQRGEAVTAIDVIRALWDDESRATEILQSAGYNDELIALDFPAQPGRDDGDLLPVLRSEAWRCAREVGRDLEIATEHLLAGLAVVASDIQEILIRRGLNLTTLAEAGSPGELPISAPLPVEPDAQLSSPPSTEAAAVGRILDAAANRCREGLRVVEDCVRFAFDDHVLTEILKSIRHDLATALREMNADEWVRFRDTRGDVGTSITTAAERQRSSLESLAAANCKRVEEALRTLEEYSKLNHRQASARLEALRYRFYTVEQSIVARRLSREKLADARLYLLLTDRSCPQGLGPVAMAAIAGGVDVIQLREKDVSDRRLLDLAKRLREWTREAGVLLVINDRPDIAALVEADGVHLGQDDLTVDRTRRIVGSRCLIGVSTHSIVQAREAVLAGADYLGVGPVFPSETKSFDEFTGLDFVREAAAEIRIPWFAIGGIDESNLSQLQEAGAERVAISRVVCAADDPAAVVRAFQATLRSRPLRTSGESP